MARIHCNYVIGVFLNIKWLHLENNNAWKCFNRWSKNNSFFNEAIHSIYKTLYLQLISFTNKQVCWTNKPKLYCTTCQYKKCNNICNITFFITKNNNLWSPKEERRAHQNTPQSSLMVTNTPHTTQTNTCLVWEVAFDNKYITCISYIPIKKICWTNILFTHTYLNFINYTG